MTARISDVDHGYRALVERVFGVARSKPTITIGVHAVVGEEPHNTKERTAEGVADSIEGAITILQVAVFNEFGTDRIPARSFIRAWFDENEASLRRDLTKLMQSVVLGRRTKEQILKLLGQRAVGEIQRRMAEGIGPENAPSTVEAKGSSTPLIASGQLRSSITFEVQ